MNERRAVLFKLAAMGLALGLSPVISASAAVSESPPVGIKGYDPVDYFTDKRPVRGTAGISYDFDEARYLFSSSKHREAFIANPDRYAPQFAGHCSAGLANGKKTVADPKIWAIVDGKLYLFASPQAKEKLAQDPGLLARSHKNWQGKK
jgi:YHS domain-containing protein